MLTKIQFEPNIPVLVALKYADGKLTEGRFGDQMYYTFTEDRCAYLDLAPATVTIRASSHLKSWIPPLQTAR
jgi:hypothetical protein